MYDVETREWGSATSQGKDLRDVTYANFFPVSMGANFLDPANQFHLEELSVGTWKLYKVDLDGKNPRLYCTLNRSGN